MNVILFISGAILILIILGDAFETIVLPRRVTRRVRLSRLFFRSMWRIWLAVAGLMRRNNLRDTFLGFFGPLAVIFLIILWATGLIIGFALLHLALETIVKTQEGFGTYVYLSGTTFFTLGLGDIVPNTSLGRGLVAFESGLGLGFLALVISYLPLLNQSFARREIAVALLDSHAGSPPTASEMLLRHIHNNDMGELNRHFEEWEKWSSELLESLLSYPMLAFFRSQHQNQSWLGSLTAILDACAFIMAGTDGKRNDQARFTFAMIRHTIVDIAQTHNCAPIHPEKDRLTRADLERICSLLGPTGLSLPPIEDLERKLSDLRQSYEPHIHSLSQHIHVTLPPWILQTRPADNWQTDPWRHSFHFHSGASLEDDGDKAAHR
jgi:hypothetical protein